MQHSEDLDNYGYVNQKCLPQYEMWKLQNKSLGQKQVKFASNYPGFRFNAPTNWETIY